MSKITDYAFLFQNSFGTSKFNPIGSFKLSQINSSSVQKQLKAAGIDTNSKQYKAVMKKMMSDAKGNGAMYTNPQAIKNLMKNYDSDGDWVDPVTGLAGLLVTEENESTRRQIISIPESSRQEMFELTKKEFLRENGVHNGDTTKRSDVYTNLYRKMEKNDRLAAGWTMQQYERAYNKAFYEAAKAADPAWQIGRPIPKGALDGITREEVEKTLVQSGNELVSSKISSETSQSAGTYSVKTVSSVENAFASALKENPPKIAQNKELKAEFDENIRAEKMKRLEQQLKDGNFESDSGFDIKA